jgi:thiamine-monophosphate kinase
VKLSQIGELALLEQIRKDFAEKSRHVLVSIGDDAAVLKPLKQNLLVTTDMMVEGIHFDLRFTTPYQLGFKLISVNVSDIYAMGGKPCYALLNVALRKGTKKEFFDDFFIGVLKALKFYRTILIGGDISSACKTACLSATVLGYGSKHITRAGARAGDKIYVTGTLGNSACGLALLKRIKRPFSMHIRSKRKEQKATCRRFLKNISWDTIEPLFRRHLMPEARSPEKLLRSATSMIDISDGLMIDLSRICNESNVGARIYLEKIPLSAELKQAALFLKVDPIKFALSGGEDYELLFTAPPRKRVEAIHIGEITRSDKVIIDYSGREEALSEEGYQHFR